MHQFSKSFWIKADLILSLQVELLMQTKTEVILIRHGETEWNLSGRWQGHADSPLSNRGIEQAEALGKRMLNEKLDLFYSSDLERARHTSRLVGGPSGLAC